MLKFSAFSSLYIALNATALSLFYQVISGSIHIPRTIVILLGTFLSYTAVQLFPLKSKLPRNERARWILSHRTSLLWAMSMSCVVILFLIPWLAFEDIFNFSHLFVLALFYEQVVTKKNIRSIPYAKPFLISYVWTMACAFPSVSESLQAPALLECFLFIFSLCLLFDLRDIEDDKSQGVVTFATRFSPITLKVMAASSFAIAMTIIPQFLDIGLFSIALYSILGLVIIFKPRPSTADLYYLIAVDGLIGVKLFLLLAAFLK